MIEKLKMPETGGWWIDDQGLSHKSKLDYLLTGVLGFCGCGNPESAARHLRDSLQFIKDRAEIGSFEGCRLKEDKIFGSMGAAYFMYYWLDKEGFTEHGGSIPGWLEEKGEELLNDLNWCIENEMEEED